MEKGEVKQIDPRALASITTGIMLMEGGFSAIHEAAEWLLGHPVWTHELPDLWPRMRKCALEQFPAMPVDQPEDFRQLASDISARYGETVDVRRGAYQRSASPEETLAALGLGHSKIIAIEGPTHDNAK